MMKDVRRTQSPLSLLAHTINLPCERHHVCLENPTPFSLQNLIFHWASSTTCRRRMQILRQFALSTIDARPNEPQRPEASADACAVYSLGGLEFTNTNHSKIPPKVVTKDSWPVGCSIKLETTRPAPVSSSRKQDCCCAFQVTFKERVERDSSAVVM